MIAQIEEYVEQDNVEINFPNKLVLAYKNKKKTNNTDEFQKLNNQIKYLEFLQTSALNALNKRVIKFEARNKMTISKFSNVLFTVINKDFKELAEYILINNISLSESNLYIQNKLKNAYGNFYKLVTSQKYLYLGEKWVTIPVIENSEVEKEIITKNVMIKVDGNDLIFPVQINDLRELEFYTVSDLPGAIKLNNKPEGSTAKTLRKVKKVVLLRI